MGSADFRDPLARAATLGKPGKYEEGRRADEELLAFKPDFPKRARILIDHFVKFEDITEGIIDGLEKSGLEIESCQRLSDSTGSLAVAPCLSCLSRGVRLMSPRHSIPHPVLNRGMPM